jgi:hypothetical protein
MTRLLFAVAAYASLHWVSCAVARAQSERSEDLIHQDPKPVWVEANLGYSYVDLGALSYDNLYPSNISPSSSGGTGGVAAGIAFDFFTVGTRFTGAAYSDFGLGTVTFEGGVRLRRVEAWELYTRAGAGYAWVMGGSDDARINNLSINGWTLILGVGVNVYPSKTLSIGGGLNFSTLSLTRKSLFGAPPTDAIEESLSKPGSAAGVSLTAQILQVTLHL